MNVPRPERGYWAKLAVRKAPLKPQLPEAGPGDELVWSRYGEYSNVARCLPRPPIQRRRSRPATIRIGQHPLIQGAKVHFENSYTQTENGYIKPYKRILVDLLITKATLEKALDFAERLFSNFEESGHNVVLAPRSEHFQRAQVDERRLSQKNQEYRYIWGPYRCTVVYIGTVAIGLTIFEISEEVEVRYVNGNYIPVRDYVPSRRGRYTDLNWKAKRFFPTGRLCLQAYSPYPRANWIKQWIETENKDLISQIKPITKELEKAVFEIAKLVEEGEIQAEIERKEWDVQKEKWERERIERHAAEAQKQSKTELLQIIDQWAEANRKNEFFRDVEHKIADLNESDRLRITDRLKRARQLIGSVDALENFLKWKSPDEL
jgi:hypothetical protein